MATFYKIDVLTAQCRICEHHIAQHYDTSTRLPIALRSRRVVPRQVQTALLLLELNGVFRTRS